MDQFDIQRQWDSDGADLENELFEELGETREQNTAGQKRLVALDGAHYFDRRDKVVLKKSDGRYTPLEHVRSVVERDEDEIRAEAAASGFKELSNGLFWNATSKHLYVRQANHFVLYS